MKIKKFNSLNEINTEDEFHVIVYIDAIDNQYPNIEIFNNRKDAMNTLRNIIYNNFVDNEEILQKLDNAYDENELIDIYESYEDRSFYYLSHEMVSKNILLDDWIKIRKDSIKYNL